MKYQWDLNFIIMWIFSLNLMNKIEVQEEEIEMFYFFMSMRDVQFDIFREKSRFEHCLCPVFSLNR